MTLEKVSTVETKTLIKRKYCKMKNLRRFFEDFLDKNVQAMKVEWTDTDYKNLHSAYNSLHAQCRHWGYPIAVMQDDGVIYLVRTDI